MKKLNISDKLAFAKASVLELNGDHLLHVNGGTSYLTVVGPSSIFYTIIVSDLAPAAQ